MSTRHMGGQSDQGVIRGSSFLHPTLRFSIDFPEGMDDHER
jgi:predicted Zn-dependent protease